MNEACAFNCFQCAKKNRPLSCLLKKTIGIEIYNFRKKRNRTFDSKKLLSLQLNPSYQQTEPSLYAWFFHCYTAI